MPSSASSISHTFHRIGLFAAAGVGTVGVVLIVIGTVRLGSWHDPTRIPWLFFELAEVGLACLVIYGIVRAIGWMADKLFARRGS